jgi:hypothetical protein
VDGRLIVGEVLLCLPASLKRPSIPRDLLATTKTCRAASDLRGKRRAGAVTMICEPGFGLGRCGGPRSAAGGGRRPGLNLDRGRRRDQVREIRACNEVLSHIPTRSSPVGARTGAPRNEGYLPPAGERGNERHRLGRSHLCDSSGFRSLASIARCLLPGLGSPSSVSLHGRISFGSPLVRQTSPARRVRAEPQPRRAAILRIASAEA